VQSLAKETITQAKESKPQATPSDCSAQLIEVTPVIMRRIRNEMRRRTMQDMTMPQFRALGYIKAHPGTSVSDVADHLGFTLPSASKLVQHLVAQKVVVRRDAEDRRRVCLSLTQEGITALAKARLETQLQLTESLGSLTQKELSAVSTALSILNMAFSGGSTGGSIH
jgi:DNA-binding MarR family transcriptional regulator